MMLSERIAEEVKAAQKSGNGERLGVLRFVSAQLQNRAIEKRGTGQSPQLTDADVRESLQKEAKKRREAAELFRKGGREDLASREEAELKIIEEFLPPPVERSEVEKFVSERIAAGIRDFGALMKEVKVRFEGQVDGRMASEIVKGKLG